MKKFNQIENLILSNNPKMADAVGKAKAAYIPAKSAMNALKVDQGNFSSSQVGNEGSVNKLVDLVKKGSVSPGTNNENKLESIKKFVDPKGSKFAKMEEDANKIKFNDKMRESKIMGLGMDAGYAAGHGVNAVKQTVAPFVNGGKELINKVISRFPQGSPIYNKLDQVMKLEPNAQNRAMFTLQQQPWFRNLIPKEDENK